VKLPTRTTVTHGEVDGLPVESVSYDDGRAFVAWGGRHMPLSEVDKLLRLLGEARVAAALRPALAASVPQPARCAYETVGPCRRSVDQRQTWCDPCRANGSPLPAVGRDA
jgi:hypothetical protein